MENIVLYWNKKALEIFNKHENPGDDSRRMAVLHIAMHNTLNTIIPKYELYKESETKVTFNKPIDKNKAVEAAAIKILRWAVDEIKPTSNAYKDDKESLLNKVLSFETTLNNSNTSQEFRNGVKLGLDCANAIIDKIANLDGHKNLDPPKKPDCISPSKEFQFCSDYYDNPKLIFLSDWGGKVTPFCTKSNDQFRQSGPKYYKSGYSLNKSLNESVYDKSLYEKDLNEVKEFGAMKQEQNLHVKNHLKAYQTKIAWWSDLRFHIIWNNFALEVIKSNNSNNLDEWDYARILALIHTSMADGASAVLNDLYFFNHWRPVTAMKFYGIKRSNSIFGKKGKLPWQPFIPEQPRVPEYPSMFGVLGAAVGEILKEIYTDNIELKSPELNFLNDVKYKKISHAVEDNAITKIYCGWNFRKSALDGISQGEKIGKYIFDNYFRSVS